MSVPYAETSSGIKAKLIPSVSITPGSIGPWTVEQFEIPEQSIENVRLMMSGRGCRPGKYTKLVHEKRGLIMSDTDAEKADHYAFVRAADGHCLMNGLGIGMCLNAILKKPDVTRVSVIEIDPDIISLVGPNYTDPRIKIINADAYKYSPPKGTRYGAVWHDIWDNLCTDNLDEMARLHRKYGRRTDWQGSWGHEMLKHQRRQDKRDEQRWAMWR